jgi:hypothetical protein
MTTTVASSDLLKVINWLNSIGISVKPIQQLASELHQQAHIDNIWIYEGEIYINDKTHCGDLLHEAGHLATTPTELRCLLSGNLEIELFEFQEILLPYEQKLLQTGVEDPVLRAILEMGETATIAWSFAAADHLSIDTFLPFENGFENEKGEPDGLGLWQSLEISRLQRISFYPGINSLFHSKMLKNYQDFPHLDKWVQI